VRQRTRNAFYRNSSASSLPGWECLHRVTTAGFGSLEGGSCKEPKAQRNIDLMCLTGRLTSDFETIATAAKPKVLPPNHINEPKERIALGVPVLVRQDCRELGKKFRDHGNTPSDCGIALSSFRHACSILSEVGCLARGVQLPREMREIVRDERGQQQGR
jgi:hypothetical protein